MEHAESDDARRICGNVIVFLLKQEHARVYIVCLAALQLVCREAVDGSAAFLLEVPALAMET